MFSRFDTHNSTGKKLYGLRVKPVESLFPFLEDVGCDMFSGAYLFDFRGQEVSIAITVHYALDCNLPPFTLRKRCHVLIAAERPMLLEHSETPTDSITHRIKDWYLLGDRKESEATAPSEFHGLEIALLWFSDLSEVDFNRCFQALLEGYAEVASIRSKSSFDKSICDLTSGELRELNKHVPFNLITQFWPSGTGYSDYSGQEQKTKFSR